MQIKTAHLKQFSVFRNAELTFAPGINVLIGANASGKSHLMKVLYAMLHTAYTARQDKLDNTMTVARLKEKLVRVFRPTGLSANRLVHRQLGRASAAVATVTDSGSLAFRLTTQSNLTLQQNDITAAEPPIFIPSREALAMYHGFVQAYENRELDFDETYRDICVALSGGLTRGPKMERAGELMKPLLKVLGGKVLLQDDHFSVYSGDGVIEAHLLSEGLRKIASIAHLINNGALLDKGVLFWDEPEANLNPELVTVVCNVLRQLAASGVQVFIATHDYLVTQELALAAEYRTKPEVAIRFFAFSRSEQGGVTVEANDSLAALRDDPILAEFAAHYDREAALFAKSR